MSPAEHGLVKLGRKSLKDSCKRMNLLTIIIVLDCKRHFKGDEYKTPQIDAHPAEHFFLQKC